MDSVTLAHQATDIILTFLPAIYTGKYVVDKAKDRLLEKGIDKLSSKSLGIAKDLLDKIRSKKSETIESALNELSKDSENPNAKNELRQEIHRLIKEDQKLAEGIELIAINLNFESANQLAVGNNNIFINIETPSRDDHTKIVDSLNSRTKKAKNQEIMSCYNSSMLLEYPEKLKKLVNENRAYELREALKYLEKHRILLISGVGGVGKSTLARALIDLRPTNIPEPFWFSFYENPGVKLSDILEKLADYIKAPEIKVFKSEMREPSKTDIDKLTGEFNSKSEIWLFFDDLSMVLEGTKFSDEKIELLFASLRYRTHNAKIIITSRILPKLGNGESLIDVVEDEEKKHLNGLETHFAVDYLVKNGLGSLEPDKLKELSEGVDGHPLALKLLRSLVIKFGISDTLKDMTRYKKLTEDTIKKTKKLFDKLAGNEKELLERISVYRKAVTMNAIEIMFTDKTPIDAVDNLIDESLLETDHKGKYWLHPLVQEFSYTDLKNKKEVHELAMRYYLSFISLEKSEKKEDFPYLFEALHHSFMAEEHDQAYNILIKQIHETLDLRDIPSQLIFLRDLCSRLFFENPRKEIILKKKESYVAIFAVLGMAYRALGKSREAIECYETALKIEQEIEFRLAKGIHLGYLGLAYSDLGEPRKGTQN